MAELPNVLRLKGNRGWVEEHDGDVRFKSGSGNVAVSCMRNASGHNYRNSSVIVDLAMGQLPRYTERICCFKMNTQVQTLNIHNDDLYAELRLALWNSTNQNQFAICRVKIAIDYANYELICKIFKNIVAFQENFGVDVAHSRTR